MIFFDIQPTAAVKRGGVFRSSEKAREQRAFIMTLNRKTAKWVRTPEALDLLSAGRTTLYSLADFNGGPIKTSCLKKRGKTRGIRLWSVDSIESFIEESVTV